MAEPGSCSPHDTQSLASGALTGPRWGDGGSGFPLRLSTPPHTCPHGHFIAERSVFVKIVVDTTAS